MVPSAAPTQEAVAHAPCRQVHREGRRAGEEGGRQGRRQVQGRGEEGAGQEVATADQSEAPAKKAAGGGEQSKGAADKEKFVEAQRLQLLEERESYNRQASSLRAEAEQLAADREPGDVQFDEESGEGDTLNVERERDLALSAQAMGAVDEIDKALLKIEAGTYGICEKCGEPIPRERLRALPYAALCVRCKSMGLSRR